MTKISEKFIKNIKKLDNYYLLKENSDYLIIGTEIEVIEHQEINTNIFMPYTKKIQKKIYTAFMLIINESKESQEYINKKIPILTIPSNLKISSLKEHLDNYTNTLKNNGV